MMIQKYIFAFALLVLCCNGIPERLDCQPTHYPEEYLKIAYPVHSRIVGYKWDASCQIYADTNGRWNLTSVNSFDAKLDIAFSNGAVLYKVNVWRPDLGSYFPFGNHSVEQNKPWYLRVCFNPDPQGLERFDVFGHPNHSRVAKNNNCDHTHNSSANQVSQ